LQKLTNRINSEGVFFVKSQKHRTQLANKEEVREKMNELIKKALEKKKKRIATKASKASKEKRLESKKKNAETKSDRKRINFRNL
jgi:ribosome-associated protein